MTNVCYCDITHIHSVTKLVMTWTFSWTNWFNFIWKTLCHLTPHIIWRLPTRWWLYRDHRSLWRHDFTLCIVGMQALQCKRTCRHKCPCVVCNSCAVVDVIKQWRCNVTKATKQLVCCSTRRHTGWICQHNTSYHTTSPRQPVHIFLLKLAPVICKRVAPIFVSRDCVEYF